MRVKKNLIPTRNIKYKCELEECPKCKAPIGLCNYRSGVKIVQTLKETEKISYIPGECINPECESKKWQSWKWQGQKIWLVSMVLKVLVTLSSVRCVV